MYFIAIITTIRKIIIITISTIQCLITITKMQYCYHKDLIEESIIIKEQTTIIKDFIPINYSSS